MLSCQSRISSWRNATRRPSSVRAVMCTEYSGYLLAHLLVRHVPPVAQLAVLAALWLGVVLTAPVGELRPFGETAAGLPPVLWLLGTLAGTCGVGVVAAASLTPLVQAWLARANAGAASADPYFLYAASNTGSTGALLAYPFLLEPFLGLDLQAWAWSGVLLGLAALLVALWFALPRDRAPALERIDSIPVPEARPKLPLLRITPTQSGSRPSIPGSPPISCGC